MQSAKSILKSLFVLFFCLIPALLYAQQGRGIFFSSYGQNAPASFGNFNTLHAFYFEVPMNETRPVYLRIFDADLGGQYDEKHDNFNTTTKFIVLGGTSAGHIYGTAATIMGDSSTYRKQDVEYEHVFGQDREADGRWISLTRLDPSKGYDTGKGYARFVLLVKGMKGDDGNYFDLALSYSQTAKVPPSDTKSYVYDMSLVSPSLLVYHWKSFHGQIELNTYGKGKLVIHTYDFDDVPISISPPFHSDIPLKSSGDGVWVGSAVSIPDSQNVKTVGFNFYGRNFNNTFGFYYTDAAGHLLPVYLPIKDYEPTKEPEVTYNSQIDAKDCRKVHLQMQVNNGEDFKDIKAKWVVDGDTLKGTDVSAELDTTGYHPYTLLVSGLLNGGIQHLEYRDSVYVNMPPTAWAGANRVFVPGKFMAFDGTVSEDPDGHITKYLWDFGDGTTGQGARIDHIFKDPGTYKVTLHVFDNSGSPCGERSASVSVMINRPPVATITVPHIVQEGKRFWLDGTSSEDPDGKITRYEWHVGSDSAMYGPKIAYVAVKPGNLPISLKVTDNAQTLNSSDEAHTVIHVNYPPVAVITADHQVVSPDLANHFSANGSKDPDGTITGYEWNFGDGSTAEGQAVDHAWKKPGDYKLVLRVQDNSGGATGTDSMMVHVNAPPVPEMQGKLLVTRGIIRLSAAGSDDPDGKIISYHWDFGDGTSSDGITVEHKYRKTGKYPVKLTVTDNSNTQSAVQTIVKDAIVDAPPVAVFGGPDQTVPGQAVTFDASGSHDPDGQIVSYHWNFGDGKTDSGQVVHHAFTSPGTYQVQLVLMDNTGMKEAAGYHYEVVKVNHPPVVEYDAPALVVPGSEVQVDLSKSYDPDGHIKSYYWFEDGKWTQGPAKKTITIADGKVENIRVGVDDDSGQPNDRSEKLITLKINHPPAVVLARYIKTANREVLLDASASNDPDRDPLSYTWNFGDHTSGNGPVANHLYPAPGKYTAVLKVDDGNGLSNSITTDSVHVFINRPPVAEMQFSTRAPLGDSVQFQSKGSNDPDGDSLKYEWNFGDGSIASQAAPLHRFTSPGIYTVRLQVDDGEGLSNSVMSQTSRITVVGPPKAVAGPDRIVDAGEPVRFDGSRSSVWDNTIAGYHWDFGDGSSGNGEQIAHSYGKPGIYDATLTVVADSIGSAAQTATDHIQVRVLPAVSARFDIPQAIRAGTELRLDASPSQYSEHSVLSIRWKIDNKDTLNWAVGNIEKDSAGHSLKKWTSSASGTLKGLAGSRLVSSDSLPVSSITLPVGEHEISLMLETKSLSGIHWSPEVHYIRVVPVPVVAMTKVGVQAPGQTAHFSVSGTGINEIAGGYWLFGDGGRAEGLFVSHVFEKPGRYPVIFNGNDALNGQPGSIRLADTVVVNAPPEPVISGPAQWVPGDTLSLSASASKDNDGKIIAYRWNFSDGTITTGPIARHVFAQPGDYDVKLSVTDNAGAVNSTRFITREIRVAARPNLSLDIPDVVCPGTELNLTSTVHPAVSNANMEWFINGKRESLSSVTAYHFVSGSTYQIIARVPYGASDTVQVKKTVRVNAPARISAVIPDTVQIGEANDFAIFNASKTYDPDGDPVNITWDFGDGSGAVGSIVEHQYHKAGVYNVTLTASDPEHAGCGVVKKQYTITVTNE